MNNLRNKLLIAGSLILGFTTISCVSKDPFFGNTLIPPNQAMNTVIDSSVNVNTYILTLDSLPMNNYSFTMIIGKYTEPIAGEFQGSFVTNLAPMGFDNDYAYFGYKDVKMDSATINTYFVYQKGDKKIPMLVDVYRVDGFNFLLDSMYYSNFPIEKYLNPQTPLVTFSIDSSGIFIEKLPKWFYESLYDPAHDSNNVYYSDLKFHKAHNGLYFHARPQAPGGSLYTLSMEQLNMFLYYSNKDDAAKPDSVYEQQYFAHLENAYGSLTPYNTCLQIIKNDYSKADPDKGGVDYRIIGDTIHPSSKCFVSGPVGLMTRVDIIKDEFTALLERVKAQGYSTIALHKAELQWQKVDKTWQSVEKSYLGLGLYHNLLKSTFIPDYDPLVFTTTNTTAPLGGELNRSTGVYSMDITRYAQSLVSGSGSKNYTTNILPLFGNLREYNQTSMWGTSTTTPNTKPLLILTYTMIK